MDISFLEQMQEYTETPTEVEVITKNDREISGRLHKVGTDFISVIFTGERTIETSAQGQDGVVEHSQNIQVYELESFIKFEDIQAISRVLKNRIK